MTLITIVMSLQTGPLKDGEFVIMNTSSAMMTADLFSKPVPQLAGALALVITSEHTRKCVGFHRREPQRQWWQCLATR